MCQSSSKRWSLHPNYSQMRTGNRCITLGIFADECGEYSHWHVGHVLLLSRVHTGRLPGASLPVLPAHSLHSQCRKCLPAPSSARHCILQQPTNGCIGAHKLIVRLLQARLMGLPMVCSCVSVAALHLDCCHPCLARTTAVCSNGARLPAHWTLAEVPTLPLPDFSAASSADSASTMSMEAVTFSPSFKGTYLPSMKP